MLKFFGKCGYLFSENCKKSSNPTEGSGRMTLYPGRGGLFIVRYGTEVTIIGWVYS
jgi:hypothetical protein